MMTQDDAPLTELRDRLLRDEEALQRWGHTEQARVLSICREDLAAEDAKESDGRLGTVVQTWQQEADTLERYGHYLEAESLRRTAAIVQGGASQSGHIEDGGEQNSVPQEPTRTANKQVQTEPDEGRTGRGEGRPEPGPAYWDESVLE